MDAVEQSLKDAKIRQEKAEEESVELSNKQKHLEIEVDVYGEKLTLQMMDQETMEAKVMAAEAEFNRLNRRVQELEEDLETTENKYVIAMQKYDKAATTADDSDRKRTRKKCQHWPSSSKTPRSKPRTRTSSTMTPRRKCKHARLSWRWTVRGPTSVSSRSSSWRRS